MCLLQSDSFLTIPSENPGNLLLLNIWDVEVVFKSPNNLAFIALPLFEAYNEMVQAKVGNVDIQIQWSSYPYFTPLQILSQHRHRLEPPLGAVPDFWKM